MPGLSDLSPTHQLLVATLKQPPHVLDSWVALGLAQPTCDRDGHTDLTALRTGLDELTFNHTDLGQRLMALMKAGCRPFEVNTDGQDAFDCWSWVAHPPLIQAFLDRDPPDLVELMNRKPQVVVPRTTVTPPHHWAAWALANRGDELAHMHKRGWPWPDTILGWAHPAMIEHLLEQGAPWSSENINLWNARVKAGGLTLAEVKTMSETCTRQFGAQMEDRVKVLEDGRDLLRMVKTKGRTDDLLAAVQQHPDLSSWTVLYQGQARPVFERLLVTCVNRSLSQAQQIKLSGLITQEFERLAGDPNQPFGPNGPRLGTVIQVLGRSWANPSPNEHPPQWSQLKPRVAAWTGTEELATLLACADELQRLALFDRQKMEAVATRVNHELFQQVSMQLSKGHPDHPLVQLAVERVQDPLRGVGFWESSVLNVLCGKPSSQPWAAAGQALAKHLAPDESLLSLGAYLAQQPWASKEHWDHLAQHLDRLTTSAQHAQMLNMLPSVADGHPQLAFIRQQLEARLEAHSRSAQAGELAPVASRRPRARS